MDTKEPTLQSLIFHSDFEEVRRLLSTGIDVNSIDDSGLTPLSVAVEYKKMDIIPDLLSHGADPHDPDVDGNSLLHWAVRRLKYQLVQYLLEHNANPNYQNNQGQTPLYWMAINYKDGPYSTVSMDIVKLLLHAGADKNIPDNHGVSAIEKFRMRYGPNGIIPDYVSYVYNFVQPSTVKHCRA